MIEFNKVTWYSKLAAAVFLLIFFPIVAFCIGVQYGEIRASSIAPVYSAPKDNYIEITKTVAPGSENLKYFTAITPLTTSASTYSNIVGHFGYGNFSLYMPQWISDHWKMESIANGGMKFSPKLQIENRDFSDITIALATTTESSNAETLYSENLPADKRKLCISGSRCDAPENDVSIITSEILISTVSDTRIYHIARLVPYGRIQDSFYIDGRELTATIHFSAPQENYALYEPKIKEFVQGIGKAEAPQG